MKTTAQERNIAREFGITDAGLHTLLRIKRGDNISGGNAGLLLEKQGLVTDYKRGGPGRQLTVEGENVITNAIRRGY